MSAQVGQRSAFEAAIDAAPDAANGYAVLGDWLSQEGDPRGELIALQQLSELDRRQRERVKALLYEPSIRCLAGPLAQWRWGFVHTATLVRPTGPGASERIDLARLLGHPSLRFLRALTLGQEPLFDALDELAAAAPQVLSSLTLYSPRVLELSRVPSLSSLTQLQLSVPEVAGALAVMPRLDSMTLSFLSWDGATARGLFEANERRLAMLKLVVAGALELEPLEAVLALPRLEHLTLEASEMGVDAIEAIAASDAVNRLVTLDLSRSGLSERGAKRLLQVTRQLPRLSSLVLGDAADP
ncbi:MAG: TIGR02996 domain-containing protein [Myxococcales bacterium]|nr:TIGR02996 domain-containing protein [Myxococcales bacterium]